jgi:hypothetical protein
MAVIDEKHLKGLKFKGAKKKKGEPGERPRHVPFERPLQARDVLDYRSTIIAVSTSRAPGCRCSI